MVILRKIKMGSISKRGRKKSYRAKWHTRESFYEIKVVDSSLKDQLVKLYSLFSECINKSKDLCYG